MVTQTPRLYTVARPRSHSTGQHITHKNSDVEDCWQDKWWSSLDSRVTKNAWTDNCAVDFPQDQAVSIAAAPATA